MLGVRKISPHEIPLAALADFMAGREVPFFHGRLNHSSPNASFSIFRISEKPLLRATAERRAMTASPAAIVSGFRTFSFSTIPTAVAAQTPRATTPAAL